MKPPLPNTYWVIQNRLLAGEHPHSGDALAARHRLQQLHAVGMDYFVDLTHEGERPDYQPMLPRGCHYLRSPIVDTMTPDTVEQMRSLQASISAALSQAHGVYVHCRAGIGRTGTVIGCHLVEQGLDGREALRELNRLWRYNERSKSWPRVPQTPEQATYIERWPFHQSKSRHRADGRDDGRPPSGVISRIVRMGQRMRGAGRGKV